VKNLAFLAMLYCATLSFGQEHKTRVSLTASSNVASAAIQREFDSRCAEVVITVDQSKASYFLEAINTGAGKARAPYKFSLFDSAGDHTFGTETASLGSAVKDVCKFIQSKESKESTQAPG